VCLWVPQLQSLCCAFCCCAPGQNSGGLCDFVYFFQSVLVGATASVTVLRSWPELSGGLRGCALSCALCAGRCKSIHSALRSPISQRGAAETRNGHVSTYPLVRPKTWASMLDFWGPSISPVSTPPPNRQALAVRAKKQLVPMLNLTHVFRSQNSAGVTEIW